MKIAVIGAGNVGVVMAAELTLRGHNVTLVKSSALPSKSFDMLLKTREVVLKEDDNFTTVNLSDCTTDLEVVRKSEVVIIATQTQYHEGLVQRISPMLAQFQTVIFVPSYLSSYYIFKEFNRAHPTIIEMTGPPTEGRIELGIIPDKVVFRISSRLKRNICSVSYNGNDYWKWDELRSLGYNFENGYSRVQAALMNPNLVLHTAGSVLSIPRIEKSHGDFCLYHECYAKECEGMFKIVESLNEEKNNVLLSLGCRAVGFLQTADFWGENAMDKFLVYASSNDRAKAPTSIHSRYITEDVSQGLVLLESIGKHLGVPTPIATALINIAGAALGIDFRKDGRTIEHLGVSQYDLTNPNARIYGE